MDRPHFCWCVADFVPCCIRDGSQIQQAVPGSSRRCLSVVQDRRLLLGRFDAHLPPADVTGAISADLLPQYVRFLSFEHVNRNVLCPVAAASLPSSRHVFTGCGLLLLFDRAVQLAGKSPNSSHKTPNPNTSKS